MKKHQIMKILEWALRLNVFLKLFIYGTGKIIGGQFYLKGEIPEAIGQIPLAETGSYDLAWTFFGHSKGYILFIGISQLIGAFLLLFNKTKLLGSAILIPILLNIIVVDYFFGVARGALFSACFYLGSLVLVLYWERERVAKAIASLLLISEKRMEKKQRFTLIVFMALAAVLIFGIEYLGIEFFGYEDVNF